MKIISCLFIFLFLSCQSHIDFNIKNNSGRNLDSVIINGLGRLKINNLKNGDEVSGYIDYSKSEETSDGGYRIDLFSSDYRKLQSFGYYTNGAPLDSGFDITIEKDTIAIKSNDY